MAPRPRRNGLRETTLHTDSPLAGARSPGCSWRAPPRQYSADCGSKPARRRESRIQMALAKRYSTGTLGVKAEVASKLAKASGGGKDEETLQRLCGFRH